MSASTALTVLDRSTGEVIDVGASTDAELAVFIDNLSELRAELAEAEAIVSGELLARLDRSASWTRRVRVGDREFEIKAPSPDAGTEAYDASLLERELRKLVERRTIDEDGAVQALDRTLTLTVRVPLGVELDQLVEAIKYEPEPKLGDQPVAVVSVAASRSVKLGGVAKLRKVDGTGAALDRAKMTKPAPARRAKVTQKTKER